MLEGKKVNFTYQGKSGSGTVVKTIHTETIAMEADSERVLLHKVKLDKPMEVLHMNPTVGCTNFIKKVKDTLLVDNNFIISVA